MFITVWLVFNYRFELFALTFYSRFADKITPTKQLFWSQKFKIAYSLLFQLKIILERSRLN